MTSPANARSFAEVASLDTLNGLLDPLALRAGWNKHEPSLWREPQTGFLPTAWSYAYAKAALDAAGRLIDTKQAERRNLFMVNPMEGNYYATLRTLVSAYQMIMPGERARSHRHTPNALRLVLDVGEDCYTVIDGVRVDMHPGDVLLTPNWAWHGHANDGRKNGYWIDFLDVPLVHLLEPMFLEQWPDGFQVPSDAGAAAGLVFAWRETEYRLRETVPDGDGRRSIELGSPALPTIAVEVDGVDAGATTRPSKTTASQVVAVIQGRGKTTVGEAQFVWSRGDVIAIPSWTSFSHAADEPSVILTVSDRPVVEKLGFLRTDAG